MEPASKRPRKPNWGEEESLQLAMLYRDEVFLLRGNIGVSNKKKHNVWEDITADINSQFHHGRTALEVKKRWFAINSKSKTRIQQFKAHRNGNGGGPPPPPLDPIEEVVSDIWGKDNSSISDLDSIPDLTQQYFTERDDQGPSVVLSGAEEEEEEAARVIVVGNNQQAAQLPLATPHSPDEAKRAAAGKEHAAAAQATAGAARAVEESARALAGAARAGEESVRALAGAARAREEAALAIKGAAEEMTTCFRALAGVVRVGEEVIRTWQGAAKEMAEAMRFQAQFYKVQLENSKKDEE